MKEIMWLIFLGLLIVFIKLNKGRSNKGMVVENFARLRGYGHPYYWKLRYEPGCSTSSNCHYDHYDWKTRTLAKNVILLD